MSKRFPFNKRTIEALSSHNPDSKSREAEYSDAECIGLKLRVSKGGRKFFQDSAGYIAPNPNDRLKIFSRRDLSCHEPTNSSEIIGRLGFTIRSYGNIE